MNELCHCGKPLHYTDHRVKEVICNMIRLMGRYVNVECEGKKWRVDRHYIALHGIKGSELANYGFEEIT